MSIDVTHFTDPGCPWAYSASPAHAVLRWRYGAGLRWRLVVIGLSESVEHYERRGYSAVGQAQGYARFRRFGMPFDTTPRERVTATAPACRAIVATRLIAPEREGDALRALQLARFNTTALFDTAAGIRAALERVDGLDADRVVAMLDDDGVTAAYEADRAEARTAAGSPTEAQGRAADTDGAIRYTAPSLLFTAQDGRRLEAGGFQPVEAYDVVIANLEPALERRPAPAGPVEAVAELGPLTTQEVAAVMAPHLVAPDRAAAEQQLIEAAAAGALRREPLGHDALWHRSD
jgi:protein-disulfide isomerase-like protein with CxxC motif